MRRKEDYYIITYDMSDGLFYRYTTRSYAIIPEMFKVNEIRIDHFLSQAQDGLLLISMLYPEIPQEKLIESMDAWERCEIDFKDNRYIYNHNIGKWV